MKTMITSASLLALLSICSATKVIAAPKTNPLTPKEWMTLRVTSQNEIDTAFESFLKATNQKFPSPTAWGPTIYKLKGFCEHPFIEADTGLQRKWLQSVRKGMMELVKIQSQKRLCKISGNNKVYAQMDTLFNAAIDKLAKLIKHPVIIDEKRMAVLQQIAYEKRLELKKKLRASKEK